MAERKTKKYDELADYGEDRFATLDTKLAAALIASIRGAGQRGQVLLDTLFVKNEAAMKAGRMVSGRQIVWLIYEYNATDRNLDVVYDIEHLSKLEWFGDSPEQIHKFRTTFMMMRTNMKGHHEDNTIAEILLKKMRKSKVLASNLIDYDNKRDQDPAHDLEQLDRYMERYVTRMMREKNDEQRTKDIGYLAQHGLHAAPGKGKGKGKGKDDKKGKGKGKDGASGKSGGKGGKGGKSGGKGKGQKGSGDDQQRPPKSEQLCRFFLNGTCKKGKDCDWKHDHKAKKAAQRSQSAGPTAAPSPPSQGGGNNKLGSNKDLQAKIKALEAERKALQDKVSRPKWCANFIGNGCMKEDCPYMHVEKDQVDKHKAAAKALAAKEKKAQKEQRRSQSAGA